MNDISGIYQIRNTINDKVYIGQSRHLQSRKQEHFSRLRNNKHFNYYLQKSFNKYGEDSFLFEILIECSIDDLDKNENLYIKNSKRKLYNLRVVDENNSFTVSEQTRDKMKTSQRKRQALNMSMFGYDPDDYYEMYVLQDRIKELNEKLVINFKISKYEKTKSRDYVETFDSVSSVTDNPARILDMYRRAKWWGNRSWLGYYWSFDSFNYNTSEKSTRNGADTSKYDMLIELLNELDYLNKIYDDLLTRLLCEE